MKNKKLTYTIAGVLLLILGLVIFITDRYWDGISAERVAKAIKDIKVDLSSDDYGLSDTSIGSNISTGYYTEEENLSVVLPVVTEDQILQGISVYKNAIEIPSVGIAVQVNEGVDRDALHGGAGHFEDTANIGESGNFAICGHASETYRCIFNSLDEIDMFDTIYAYDLNGNKHTYTVTNVNIIQPNDWSVVLEGQNSKDKLMTIITCCDNGQRRLVVRAQVLSDKEVESLIADRRSTNLKTASNYNKAIKVSSLYDYFTSNDNRVIKRYTINSAVTKDRDSTRKELYSPVLKDNVDLKEHKYPTNYSIDLGIGLNN